MVSPSPRSKRTPESTIYNNTADCIERGLAEDGHTTWGFVVYRCAYGCNRDAAWALLLRVLRQSAHKTMAFYRGLNLFEGPGANFQVTVVEDAAALDGATAAAVRDRFRAWADEPDTVAREQASAAASAKPGLNPRYRYCIRVGAEALDRVAAVAGLEGEEGGEEGVEDLGQDEDECLVDLIWKDWEPSRRHPRETPMEAIEGCTRPDVGWMRTGVRGVMVEMYEALWGQNAWYGEYRRPYEVVYL